MPRERKSLAPEQSEGDSPSPVVTTTDSSSDGMAHLAAGEAADPYNAGEREPYLDPKLAEIRDAEVKRNEETDAKVEPRPEPTIDPVLVEQRDAEIKRLADAAKR